MVGKSVRLVACAVAGVVALCSVSAVGMAQSVAVRPELAPVVTVSLDAKGLLLKEALGRIASQAGLQPAYGTAVNRSTVRVTVQVHNASVASAFEQVLQGTGLRAVIMAGDVLFENINTTSAPVAQGSISGKVVDSKTRQGLRGASVSIRGSTKGTTTSDDGSFRLSGVVPGSYTIQVRMLGYVKTSTSITVADGQTASIEVALEPSINALDQVVVTGTVAATAQRAVPNAMTIITAKDIEQRGITRIDQLFHGEVPGLIARLDNSSNSSDAVTMFSRGATTFTGGAASPTISAGTSDGTNPIKTYVDGVEMADPKYLSHIDPRSIERIEILTGPQASTVYGSNAINGVMQIFTKRGGNGANTPQVTASLLSGVVQNDFRSALTPQHEYTAQVRGTEGRVSYNAGGSWDFMGAWSPAKRTARLGGYGGARMHIGALTADASLRQSTTQNRSGGSASQVTLALIESGWASPSANFAAYSPSVYTQDDRTFGLTVTYAPISWWSHELVFGEDQSDYESRNQAPAYSRDGDTLLVFSQRQTSRHSLRYTTTARLAVGDHMQAVITGGVDGWQSGSFYLVSYPPALTGTLTQGKSPIMQRQPGHNRGGFAQGQLGVSDALFLTYGVRAEWNPTYGDAAQPNLAPRAGVAFTHDFPIVTAKLRASYGRSTRPPQVSVKSATPQTSSDYLLDYGPYETRLANPDLGPEYQQGGEGGLELYFGQRGSLIVTRYNQTVDGIIALPVVDSVRSLLTDPSRYSYKDESGYGWVYVSQYVNVGSIRNQGWELQGTVNTGPLSTKGTYSWTKSRVIGISPQYRRSQDPGDYQVGAAFRYLPEHTWAVTTTYARAGTTLSLSMDGAGLYYAGGYNAWDLRNLDYVRLSMNRLRMSRPPGLFTDQRPGYITADVNATHRFSANIDGVLQIQDLTNAYINDYNGVLASLGRQTKAGFRVRLP